MHALDTQTGRRIALDDSSRFAMASTFKLALAAAILSQIDRKVLNAAESISYSQSDILTNSPIAAQNLARGSMSLLELAAAIIDESDNTSANLLLGRIGGPNALTQEIGALIASELT